MLLFEYNQHKRTFQLEPGREGGRISEMVLPTLVVTVRRGFPSDDALLGISFRTMATVLSAALESFPYNSEINNDLCEDI